MNESKIAEVNALVRKNSRTELVRLCKEKNLNYSGTKHDMAVRLIGGGDPKEVVVPPSVKKIIIRRNVDHGQWEYEGLIFDDKTKNVIGRWENGNFRPLQRQDIETCKQYKFRYTLPPLLDERPDDDHHRHSTELSSDEEEEEDEGDESGLVGEEEDNL